MSLQFDGDWLDGQSQEGEHVLLKVLRRLESTQTRFQKAELVDTQVHGKALVLDDLLQAAEADEFIYHESLVHPALCACPARGRVAILGGGEGATLREVLRHPWVEQATMVDIDEQVVDFCRQHLTSFHQGAFDDPRTELVFDDARAWLERQADESFSAILFDLSEPQDDSPAQLLFTAEFYQQARRCLKDQGVFSMHAGPAMVRVSGLGELFPRSFATLKSVFGSAKAMTSFVPSFAELWTFLLARKGDEAWPMAHELDELLARRFGRPSDLRHYDGESQRGMAALPRYLREQLKDPGAPYTDAEPPRL